MSPVNQLDKNDKRDIFEAITVIAKRARQINQKRAEQFKLKTYMSDEELEESLDYDHIDFSSFEKPTTIAMREYEEEKIEFEHVEKSSEVKEDE
ncbi:MAG: DNA-directed RNA polymerase subunit omega [Candidatus Marinimicrobia bacterium]|nr:DNA-directed RNA polymerase subunit omega [Candidatus Neomarinimicrobiota bacterium]